MLFAVVALYSVLSPETRATLGDVLLLCAAVTGGAAALVILSKWGKGPRRIVVWFWRRSFGKEITVHADGSQTIVYLTPTVRRIRGIQDAIQPKLDKQTETFVAELVRATQDSNLAMSALSQKNTREHLEVTAALVELGVRVSAGETATDALTARVTAVEAALMNGSK